jgi:2-polyprenyl-6-methoxyphenol hydroxylase-like FAD-dependent oxidoreductase
MSAATTPSDGRRVRRGENAIVIGASMAGLLTARVLADFYEQVTILERDPPDCGTRQGVPQGRHVHVVLVGGANAIQSLFPGLFDELAGQGAVIADFSTKDVFWFHHGVRKLPAKVPLKMYCMTRPFLEQQVRERLMSLPNVVIRHNHSVQRLVSDEKQTRIIGVSVEPLGEGKAAETLPANFVIDASGRGSRASQWLEELGYVNPPETSVGIHIGYASRFFERPKKTRPDWKFLGIYTRAPATRKYGVIQSVEGDRWLVTLAGNLRDYPPPDDAGFLEFARQLDHPELYTWIHDATPLSGIVTHCFPAHLWRRYERLSRFPDGFLIVGDAVCSFNPIYGQGMSVSALEAQALQRCLGEGSMGTHVWRRFFQAAAGIIRSPWMLGTGADFLYPQTEGARPLGTQFLNWYTSLLYRACGSDPLIATRFYEVMNMLKGPASIFGPEVFLHVLATLKNQPQPGSANH